MERFDRGRRLAALAVALSLVLAGVPGAAGAQSASPSPEWADDLLTEFEGMAETYNANVGDAKGDMSTATRTVYEQIEGRPVNVYFHGTDVTFSFRMTDDGRIVELRGQPRDDARLAMSLTRDTAERLTAADDPVEALVSAVETGRFTTVDGERTVRGVVIRGESGQAVDQAKWAVINTVRGLVM